MMSCNCNCGCKAGCTLWALILAAVAGVLAAFLQITGAVTVTAAFLWVALGIGVVYLALLVLTGALARRGDRTGCCRSLELLLAAILGSILLALILLAEGITATGILSAVLTGGLVFSLVLVFGGSACYIRCMADCGS